MNEDQLKEHIDKFAGRGPYLLEVETPNRYTHIKLADHRLAFMLCDTAKKSGVTKYIHLFYFPNKDTEEVLFDYRATDELLLDEENVRQTV